MPFRRFFWDSIIPIYGHYPNLDREAFSIRDFAGGIKKSKTRDFQKCFQIYFISINFRQIHLLSFEGNSVDHLSAFRIFK